MENIVVNEIKFKEWQFPSWTVIVGKTGTGKSTVMKLILYYHRRKFRIPIFMSETVGINPDFDGIIPECLTFSTFPEEKLQQLIHHQSVIVKAARNGDRKYRNAILDAIVLTDDFISDASWLRRPITKALAFQFRHFLGSWILCVQDPMAIPKGLRPMIKYLVVVEAASSAAKQTLYKHYLDDSMCSYAAFSKVVDTFTHDFKVLVIDKSQGLKPQERLRFAKVIPKEDIPPFKVGSRKIWKANERLYNPRWEDDMFSSTLGTSNGVGIVIRENAKKKKIK